MPACPQTFLLLEFGDKLRPASKQAAVLIVRNRGAKITGGPLASWAVRPADRRVSGGGLTGIEDNRADVVFGQPPFFADYIPTVKSLRMTWGCHCAVSTVSSSPSI